MTVGFVVTADETDFKDLNLKLDRNKEHDLKVNYFINVVKLSTLCMSSSGLSSITRFH